MHTRWREGQRRKGAQTVRKRTRYIKVYERILLEERKLLEELAKIPVDGKRTDPGNARKAFKLISDSCYRLAQECNVLVSYPQKAITGRKIDLGGDAHIAAEL